MWSGMKVQAREEIALFARPEKFGSNTLDRLRINERLLAFVHTARDEVLVLADVVE